jgi:HEAT repeat protein
LRLSHPVIVAVLLGLSGATGCTSTPEEIRAEKAIERLNAGFAEDLDRLLQRWSAANGEANRTAADVYRTRIAHALKDRGNLDAALAGLASDDESIVATCCAAMGFAPQKGAAKYILPLLKHEHPGVRGNAALGLWLRNGEGCSLQHVTPLLSDEEAVVRQQGVLLCAKVLAAHHKAKGEDQDYYDAYLVYEEALADSDELVRVNVARGLAEVGHPAAVNSLLNRGLRDKQPRVRYEAALTLVAMKPAAAAEGILESLENEFNRHVRAQLNLALRAITGLHYTEPDDWKRELPRWRSQRAREAARDAEQK